MANFDPTIVRTKLASVRSVTNLLDLVLQVYQASKQTQALLAAYQSGTDPALVAAVNAILTSAERTELGAMLADLNTLVTAWEANHRAAIGLTP